MVKLLVAKKTYKTINFFLNHNIRYSIAGFLLIFSISILSPLKKTLLSHTIPLKYAPLAQSIFLTCACTLLLMRWGKFNPKAEYRIFLCILIFASGASQASVDHPILGIIIFSCIELFSFRSLSLFWSSCHVTFTPQEAATNYPRIIFYGQLAASLAALSSYAWGITLPYCTDTVLLLGTIAFCAFIALMPKNYSPAEKRQTSNISLREVLKNPYGQIMFLLKIFSNLLIIILEFHLITLVSLSGLAYQKQIAFFSMYYFLCQSSGILFSTLPFHRLREDIQLAVTPGTAFILCALTILWPSKELVLGTLIIIKALTATIAFHAQESLYMPASKEFKCTIKPWIDLGVKPASQALGVCINAIGVSGAWKVYYGGCAALICAFLCLVWCKKAKKIPINSILLEK